MNHIAAVVQPGTYAEGALQAAGPVGAHVERTDAVEVRPAGGAPEAGAPAAVAAPPERAETVTVRPSPSPSR